MSRSALGWLLVGIAVFACWPILEGVITVLLSPRRDIVLVLIVSLGVGLELRRCLRFFE